MTTDAVFAKLKGARASDEIAEQIRALLANGTLVVGSRLPPERVLAEKFGVSRNTLREALRSLEHRGLIRLHKGANGGAIVENRSSDAIMSSLLDMYHLGAISPEDLTQARILYEGIIIRLACTKATAADIAVLHENIDAADAARLAGDFASRIDLHIKFHRILAQIAGNAIMVAVMNGVLTIMTRFVHSIGPYDNSFVTPSRRRFMKHFEVRDADAAVKEMERLLKRLQRTYLSRVSVAALDNDVGARR